MKKTIFAFSVSVTLILVLTASSAHALSIPLLQVEEESEVPMELSNDEYSADVVKFYRSHADLVTTIDLANPKGIDQSLLPNDIQALIKPGTRVLAYRETVRINLKGGKPNGLARPSLHPIAGISCATYSGSRDWTISSIFGSVEQFNRVIALRYDWYSECSGANCKGWEIEKQYMWWKRSISSWNVKNGVMKTYIEAEDYCSKNATILNYGSTTISQPTWSGNQTVIYNISGFPNNAYVPWPSGYSYTQGDIYQGTTLKYDNQRIYQFWPMQ